MKKYLSLLLVFLLLLGVVPAGATWVEPEPMSGFLTEPMIAAGGTHTLALREDGTVWSWGDNASGQLGDGTRENRLYPLPVEGLTNIVHISADIGTSVAIGADGRMWVWGADSVGSTTFRTRPYLVSLSNNSGTVAADVGSGVVLTMRSNGEAWARGGGRQMGTSSATSNLGRVLIETRNPVVPLDNVVSVAVGSFHSLAVRGDGSVWSWGRNNMGQLGRNTPGEDAPRPALIPGLAWGAREVVAVASHSLVLMENGTVRGFGQNSSGQLGNGTTAMIQESPVQVLNLNNVIALDTSNNHSVAVRGDGTVWGWGRNGSGVLGDGTTTDSHVPVQVQGLSGVTAVAAGWNHSVALREDGTVWAWGHNPNGQLGIGTRWSTELTPVQVVGANNVGHFSLRGAPNTREPLPFDDVDFTHPDYDAIRFVYENDLMRGIGDNLFAPNLSLDRSMVATITYRLQGEPNTSFRQIFSDIGNGQWYSLPITWAYDNGIVQGIGDGSFAPRNQITQQELAVMMYRLAVSRGYPVIVWGNTPVSGQTAPWARDAMLWAVYHGFIGGNTPLANATRAQTASFAYAFETLNWANVPETPISPDYPLLGSWERLTSEARPTGDVLTFYVNGVASRTHSGGTIHYFWRPLTGGMIEKVPAGGGMPALDFRFQIVADLMSLMPTGGAVTVYIRR